MFPRPKDIEREPETVRVYASGREVCNLMTLAGKQEYKDRVKAMWERQDGRCCLCYVPLRLQDATFEHEDGRGMNGAHRDDRIEKDGRWYNGAAHEWCNSKKGSRRFQYNP